MKKLHQQKEQLMNKNQRKEVLKKLALNVESPTVIPAPPTQVFNTANVSNIIDGVIDSVCDEILNSIESAS